MKLKIYDFVGQTYAQQFCCAGGEINFREEFLESYRNFPIKCARLYVKNYKNEIIILTIQYSFGKIHYIKFVTRGGGNGR